MKKNIILRNLFQYFGSFCVAFTIRILFSHFIWNDESDVLKDLIMAVIYTAIYFVAISFVQRKKKATSTDDTAEKE